MRNILVTGGAGQVGHELQRRDWGENIALWAPTREALDIGSLSSVMDQFGRQKFDAVINAAAYTAVDKAETDSASAFLANAQGPANLAEATRLAGIPLIHVSTDYVFDGKRDDFYDEDDPVSPLGVYGASKLAGEYAVRSSNVRSVVMRTAWVLSVHRANFLKTMLRLAENKGGVRVVDDQIGCPTAAADIADALRTITLRMMEDPLAPIGVFHFVNAGETSWCGLAKAIFAQSKAAGGASTDVTAITTDQYPTPAERPANSRLSTRKITAEFGIRPRDWQLAINDIITELTDSSLQTTRA